MAGNPIPIDPATIAGAQAYNPPLNATPTNICKAPPEGAMMIPMQFLFNTTPSWFVDLSSFVTARKFTQICSMYVDATNSTHDVNIFFPDSGYTARVAFGDTAMLNVLTGNIGPKFYVILDASGATSATDVVNVFAINTFIPPSNTSIFQRSISYGYSQFFSLQPTFTQATTFTNTFSVAQLSAGRTIINHSQWYITAYAITAVFLVSGGGNSGARINFYDNGNPLFTLGIEADAGQTAQPIYQSLSNLNIISSGNGPLTAQLNFVSGSFQSTGEFEFNIFGGVLVT